jgi:adenylate cyclase
VTWRGAGVGIVCALVCWLLSRASWVADLEKRAYDNCLGFRGGRASSANVVIVGLDERSLEKIPKPLRLLSPELAQVVDYLHQQGAAAIGVDLLFPETEETIPDLLPGRPGDAAAMGRAIGRSGNVVLPILITRRQEPQLPIYEWLPVGQSRWTDLGFVDLTSDADRCLRRQRLLAADSQGRPYPSFTLALLALARNLPEACCQQRPLCLRGRPIPLDDDALPVNYVGPPGTIRCLPFSEVLQAAQGRQTLRQDWKGAIVLLGVTARVQEDLHPVPRLNQSLAQVFRSTWLYHESDEMPGVEIHANVVATLADEAFITTPWWLSTPLLLTVVGAALGAAFSRLNLEGGAVLALAHHVVWQLLGLLALRYADWRVETVAMLMLGVLLYGVTFVLRWRWMRQMMGMIKSEAVARALEAQPGKLDLRGEQREITVLFADIRNFTAFSETHTAPEVVKLLNAFFTAVVPVIEAEEGIVNQYLGDGMMVLFGAPQPQPDHALRAVRAAVGMLDRVHRLQQRFQQLGADGFRIGIGIHTGSAVVGTVGSPRRLDYTAIGDTVNTAARIESCNKQLQTEILLSEATLRALPERQRQQFSLQRHAENVLVPGKRESLTVYAIRLGDFGDSAGGRDTRLSAT